MGVSARLSPEHTLIVNSLTLSYPSVSITPDVEQQAIELQYQLCSKGYHRAAKMSDLLIATVALVHSLTVLHYDRDYELIASVTGQPVEWIVLAGSGD